VTIIRTNMIILALIPGLLSTHLNMQKGPPFAGESMYLDEACECDPGLV